MQIKNRIYVVLIVYIRYGFVNFLVVVMVLSLCLLFGGVYG